MFLGYQNEKIALVANTREELENNKFMRFDAIVESDVDYVLHNGEYVTLTQAEEQTAAEEKQAQIKSLQEQLDLLDLKAIRALRAIQAGTGTPEDSEHLEDLEMIAVQIREELSELIG